MEKINFTPFIPRQRPPSFAHAILHSPPWVIPSRDNGTSASLAARTTQMHGVGEVSDWQEYQTQLAQCLRCPAAVCSQRQRVHFLPRSQGRPQDVQVLFVLDAPSSEQPVGRIYPTSWGELLEKMIQCMNLTSYHLTLAVKCVAPNSELPHPTLKDQMGNNCRDHLLKEIIFLRPTVVATFGAYATNLLLAKKEKLANIHGKILDFQVPFGNQVIATKVVPLFHPEFLLINPNMKRTTWPDLQNIIAYLANHKTD